MYLLPSVVLATKKDQQKPFFSFWQFETLSTAAAAAAAAAGDIDFIGMSSIALRTLCMLLVYILLEYSHGPSGLCFNEPLQS